LLKTLVFEFDDVGTLAADKQQAAVSRRVPVARSIGIQRTDPMDQPGTHQEIEGAVHGDGCRVVAVHLQLVEQFICTNRSVMPTDQLVDLTTQRSKGQAPFPTQCVRETYQLGEFGRARYFFGRSRRLHLLDQGLAGPEGITNASPSVGSGGIVGP